MDIAVSDRALLSGKPGTPEFQGKSPGLTSVSFCKVQEEVTSLEICGSEGQRTECQDLNPGPVEDSTGRGCETELFSGTHLFWRSGEESP